MGETPMMGFEAKIAEELLPLSRPIDDAKLHPDNVRKHKIEKIAQSLEKHGQRAPIIVQASTGFIVKGNGTHTAAKLLGWTEVAQLWQEMNDEEALNFLYADNRSSDLATYDRKKLRDGLAKMMAGPGLFDSLWEVEEFEDLDEEMRGTTVLAPEQSSAAFADAGEKAEERRQKAGLPGEKMREVPIVLTIGDHAMFVERIKILQKRFGMGGTIATIVEAIRRQAEAEGVAPMLGKAVENSQLKQLRTEAVTELRNAVISIPDSAFSRSKVYAIFEASLAMNRVERRPEVVAGQLDAWADA